MDKKQEKKKVIVYRTVSEYHVPIDGLQVDNSSNLDFDASN